MIYLDNGATSFHKPPAVAAAIRRAMLTCANPGRGGYGAAMTAARTVLQCREQAHRMFDCAPEQVVFTANCTQGLNMAIRTLVKPGGKVVISGFEHNAVTRPLHALDAQVTVAGRTLFSQADTLEQFESALKQGVDVAVFTHVSNVFGYILPVEQMAALCRQHGVPFILDAAQSAGILELSLKKLGAAFIAMPGHKGLLGPQGTGLLLCGRKPTPLLYGGTGSNSASQDMPDELPDIAEAGTLNVPGIAGLSAGMSYVSRMGLKRIAQKQFHAARHCARGLQELGLRVFCGDDQSGTVSFVPQADCEQFCDALAQRGIAVRGGLHCAPLAHKSAGTFETGTVRVSFGHEASLYQADSFLRETAALVTHGSC